MASLFALRARGYLLSGFARASALACLPARQCVSGYHLCLEAGASDADAQARPGLPMNWLWQKALHKHMLPTESPAITETESLYVVPFAKQSPQIRSVFFVLFLL
jgi:hypothetical protein